MGAFSRRLIGHIGRPIVDFLRSEELFEAGVVLLASTLLIWAVSAIEDNAQWLAGAGPVW